MIGIIALVGCMGPEPVAPPASPISTRAFGAPPLLEPDPTPSSDPAPPAGGTPLTTDALVIDQSAHAQTITGLGVDANVHSWNGGELKAAIDRYTALGAVSWRVIIEKTDWETTRTGLPGVIDDTYYRGVLETPKMRDLWDTLAYIESKPHQDVTLSLMGGVPEWMGGSMISEDQEDYWVRMVAALVRYARTVKGLQLRQLSPFNEPDWNGVEGPKVGPAQMVRLLERLSERLDELGLGDVKFVVPDTASADAARIAYLPALLKSPTVTAKIARVGIHTYSGASAQVPEQVATGPAATAGVWATEANASCQGCDDGTAAADSWDHSFEMAHQLMSLIEQGINGWQLYDAWDGYYEHHGATGYWGLLQHDAATDRYIPRREFDVFSVFLKGLAPGSVIVHSSGAPAVRSQAAENPSTGHVSVIGINDTGATQSFAIKVSGNGALSGGTVFYTTSTSAGVRTTPVSNIGMAIVVSVPPTSVFLADFASIVH